MLREGCQRALVFLSSPFERSPQHACGADRHPGSEFDPAIIDDNVGTPAAQLQSNA